MHSKIIVQVDWAGDGFSGAADDISAYIVSGKVTEGVEVDRWRAPASVLDATLKNGDHRFTPTKSGAVSYPLRTPGPQVRAFQVYPFDDFDSLADAASLSGRTPLFDSTFAAWSGDVTRLVATSGKVAYSGTGGADIQCVLEFSEADVWVGVKHTFQTGSTAGLILRYTDTNNYLLLRPDGVDLKLYKVDAGVGPTELATAALAWTDNTEKLIVVQLHGQYVYAYVDDVLVLSASAITFNETATKHGIGGTNVATDSWFDDFGGWRPLFRGRVDTVMPRPEPGRKYAYLRAYSDQERMGRFQVYRFAPTPPTTYGAIATRILDACSFSSTNRILDTGTTLTTDPDSQKVLGRNALDESYQLQDDEVGLFWVDGYGTAHFEDSLHRDRAPHTVARATWRSNRAANDHTDKYFSSPVHWERGAELVENRVFYRYSKYSRSASVQVWSLKQPDDRPLIRNGETLRFLAVGDGDSLADPVTPTGANFKVFENQNGTGMDLTASCTVVLEAGVDGNFAMLAVTNNSGVSGYITALLLLAKRGTSSGEFSARAENSASQNTYGLRNIEHQALHLDLFAVAQARAARRIALRAEPKERLTFDMPNGTRANLMQIVHRNVSDRVTVIESGMGINGDMFVEKRVVSWEDAAYVLTCTWTLRKADSAPWGPSSATVKWDGVYNWGGARWTP